MGANDFRDLRWSDHPRLRRGASRSSSLVFARPSLGIVTVWLGMLLWICVRAVKNHTRVQGDRWLASADTVS